MNPWYYINSRVYVLKISTIHLQFYRITAYVYYTYFSLETR